MAKNTKNEKKSIENADNSAQGLLKRLSRRYDADRIASEKNAMKKLDERYETDSHSHDVVAYHTTTEMPAASEDGGVISEAEFKKLYLKYLGKDTGAQSTGYEDVHRMILEAEKRAAGIDEGARLNVEKNIDEAEKYIDAITHKKETEPLVVTEDMDTGNFDISLNSTAELSLFEPKDITVPNIPKTSETQMFVGVSASAPAQTKEEEATREAKIFEEYLMAENAEDLQPTVDISAVKEETVPEKQPYQEPKKESKKPREKESFYNGFEYTDRKQNEEIREDMRSKLALSKIRIVLSVIFAAVLFVLENVTAVSEIFPNPIVYVVTDWVLAFACAALVFERLGLAIRALFKGQSDVDTVTLWALIFSMAATATALLFETPDKLPSLYNFSFAVCVLLHSLFVYYTQRRDLFSFGILASPKEKHTVVLHDASETVAPENERFSEALAAGNMRYGTVARAEFVADYFAHRKERERARAAMNFFLPLCFAVSLFFFLCEFFIMKDNAAVSLGVAYASFMMCAPFAAFLSYAFPAFLASRRARACHSAILCDKTAERYREASLIAFRDDAVFPSSKAKVKGIRLYGDRKIDRAIYYASSIYGVIGGPLAEVFKKAALNSVNSDNVELLEVSEGGVCAMVDDKHIVIGRPAYMEEQCFGTYYDADDEDCEGASGKRILYLACDQIVIAKFYIQYAVSNDFVQIARSLSESGVSVSIRTADPCLDDGVLYDNKLDPRRYSVKVTKGCMPEETPKTVSAKRAGVVSLGTQKDLVRAVLLCRKLESVKRTNLILKLVSCVLGIAVMSLVVFTGKAPEMLSVYPALYQLFWLLPIYFVSRVYI